MYNFFFFFFGYTLYRVPEDMNWLGFSSPLPELPGRYYPSSSKLGAFRDFGS